MRADILSKRLFLAGCFGLPWLWCVHVMYWYIKSSKSPTANPEEDHVEALLNADSEGEFFLNVCFRSQEVSSYRIFDISLMNDTIY